MGDRPATLREGAGCISHLDRFEIYRVAIEFQELIPRLLPRKGHAELRDQLDRASISFVLNLAEGLGRFSRGEKAHFYRVANGSALESAAALDVLNARMAIDRAAYRDAKALLARAGQMLTRLARRVQP